MITAKQIRQVLSLKATKFVVKRRFVQERLDDLINLDPSSTMSEIIAKMRTFIDFSPLPKHHRLIDEVSAELETKDNPAQYMFRRFFQAPISQRQRMLKNLIIDGTLIGSKKRTIIEEKLGFPPPYFTVISLTFKCNARCKGCWANCKAAHDIGELSYETACKVIDNLLAIGSHFVTLTGGEPFIWLKPEKGESRIWELFKKYPNVIFQVYTNATFLADERNVERLAELGNVFPAVSIEGTYEQTLSRRGKKVTDAAFEAIRLLDKHKLLFGLSVTLMHDVNMDTFLADEFYKWARKMGVYAIWCFQYVPVGDNPNVLLMLTAAERDTLRKKQGEVWQNFGLVVLDFWNCGYLVYNSKFGSACIAGDVHCHVLPDGKVAACVFTPIGANGINLNDPDMDLLTALQHPYFVKFREIKYERRNNALIPCACVDFLEHLRESATDNRGIPAYPGTSCLLDDDDILRHIQQRRAEYESIAQEAIANGEYDRWLKR